MAKQRIRLRGTRTQSKVAQKKLMEKLKALYENPLILLPKCEHEGETCPYEQLKNDLIEIKDYFDNPPSGIFSWFKGPPKDKTARAVLSSFEILDDGKLPVVAVAKFPTGDATYAVRGAGIPKEKNDRCPKLRASGSQNAITPKLCKKERNQPLFGQKRDDMYRKGP